MNKTARNMGIAMVMLLGFVGGAAAGQTSPKALNPQPEVPSKPKATASAQFTTNPKALNPQPEVPSKPKQKKQHAPKPPKTAQQ